MHAWFTGRQISRTQYLRCQFSHTNTTFTVTTDPCKRSPVTGKIFDGDVVSAFYGYDPAYVDSSFACTDSGKDADVCTFVACARHVLAHTAWQDQCASCLPPPVVCPAGERETE